MEATTISDKDIAKTGMKVLFSWKLIKHFNIYYFLNYYEYI